MRSNNCNDRHGVFGTVCMVLMLLGAGSVMAGPKDVVYIEASTANRWKLKDFGARVKSDKYSIETVVQYDFDKTKQVAEAIKERRNKPDLIVVQECSVYFPGSLEGYKASYRSWIRQIKESGIKAAIATTVPPAKSLGLLEDMKMLVKEKMLGREGQFDQVISFNEWLRGLAKEEDVPLLDLEATVRISEADRHMRPEFNDGDGIHINRTAYDVLDQQLLRFLNDSLH